MTSPTAPPLPFDARAFRRALGAFLTGVTVVTARDPDGRAVGMTANSFTSVSLDPPLVLVCVGRASSTFAAFAETQAFAVNLLDERQDGVAAQFAERGSDRFAGMAHHPGATGSPILDDSLGWFDCRLHERVAAGDHLILIGRVEGYAITEGRPLGFWRGRFVAARDLVEADSGAPASERVAREAELVARSTGTGEGRRGETKTHAASPTRTPSPPAKTLRPNDPPR